MDGHEASRRNRLGRDAVEDRMVVVAMTMLIIAADTSATILSPGVISAGWYILVTLFYFILSWVQPFCSYAPFDWKFSDFILHAVTHNFDAAADDINVC